MLRNASRQWKQGSPVKSHLPDLLQAWPLSQVTKLCHRLHVFSAAPSTTQRAGVCLLLQGALLRDSVVIHHQVRSHAFPRVSPNSLLCITAPQRAHELSKKQNLSHTSSVASHTKAGWSYMPLNWCVIHALELVWGATEIYVCRDMYISTLTEMCQEHVAFLFPITDLLFIISLYPTG